MTKTKHFVSAWGAACLALGFMAHPLSAATFDGFNYEDGVTITITGYTGLTTGEVRIPATINGKRVEKIGPEAFNMSSVSRVLIPEGVTSIGEGAFRRCIGLTSVSLPATLSQLGPGAFEQCFRLRNVELPANLTTIHGYTFRYCSDLEQLVIPPGVTSIGEHAFSSCSGATELSLPPALRVIGQGAFSRCGSLKKVTIPATLSVIQKYAFAECSALKNITIPEGVLRIEWYAFSYCENLGKITIPSSMTRLGYGAFQGCGNMNRATFTGDAPAMEDSVFANTGASFTVLFHKGKTGFKTPTWHGYPSLAILPDQEIAIQQPSGTNLADGKAKRSFGTVELGGKGKSRTFTIRNPGSKSLLDLGITKNGPDAGDFIITGPSKDRLAPGASTTFKVEFKPKARGPRNASIQVTSNDSNENPFVIKLGGMGVR